ncbi:hypothetical protein CDAR_596891 [Caerostris darwini]|uniref:Uncharacterized protein n=1 Tax=Caerostris darwini TaxID=1538125 RepID=A0AAV4X6K3_9ARAC|nr:hypothetical protein CDAR_596891 [Caerostris darwini]
MFAPGNTLLLLYHKGLCIVDWPAIHEMHVLISPAHRQAIEKYEAVVQRLASTEEAARKLQEENQVLEKEYKNWQLERAKLIKVRSEEILIINFLMI